MCLDLRQCEIDDTLYTESQSKHQCQCHKRHKCHITINKLRLQLLMQSTFSLIVCHFIDILDHDSHRINISSNGCSVGCCHRINLILSNTELRKA